MLVRIIVSKTMHTRAACQKWQAVFRFLFIIIVISLHWNISLPNFEVCVIYARKTKILLFDY